MVWAVIPQLPGTNGYIRLWPPVSRASIGLRFFRRHVQNSGEQSATCYAPGFSRLSLPYSLV
jgi:hypothetical protein